MSEQTAGLTYKGRPLMRKDNMIYYGSMADSHIVMLQVLDTKPVNGLDVATRVSVQLLSNDPNLRSRERVVKKSEKDGLYTALDVGCVWLERKLNKPIERKSCGDVMLEKIDAAKEEQKEGAAQ